MKHLFAKAEEMRLSVKSKDEKMCVGEAQLEQARTESELISSNLKRAKQDLAKEVSQCKAVEMQINQMSHSLQVDKPELEKLREQQRRHMNAIQNLWKKKEEGKEKYESHKLTFEPQQAEMTQMKKQFLGEREILVAKLEEVYELHTGRKKLVRCKKIKC